MLLTGARSFVADRRRHADWGARHAHVDAEAAEFAGEKHAGPNRLLVTCAYRAKRVGAGVAFERRRVDRRRRRGRCRNPMVGNGERAIGEIAKRADERTAPAGRDLDQLQGDQLFRRVDPEIGAPDAAPGEATERSGHLAARGGVAQRKTESPGRAGLRAHGNAIDFGEADLGRQRVRGHLRTVAALTMRTPSSSPPLSSI